MGAVVQGIEKEYAELDTVWFMAGSLFKSYPYDIPTEAFTLELFTQVAVQQGPNCSAWPCLSLCACAHCGPHRGT